jgi:hypothetical protein
MPPAIRNSIVGGKLFLAVPQDSRVKKSEKKFACGAMALLLSPTASFTAQLDGQLAR